MDDFQEKLRCFQIKLIRSIRIRFPSFGAGGRIRVDVAGEGSQGEGESKHPLPVRLFGDFLFAQKVTPRSDQQPVTAYRCNVAAELR